MDLNLSAHDESFRHDIRSYFEELLLGEFAAVRGRGGPGDGEELVAERLAFEQRLGVDGWTCVGWPREFGGRDLSLIEQVIYFEEYARAGGPGRLGHIGEGLLGPTLIHFGTSTQQNRFLPEIRFARELWCQGFSEPNAGSDLANLATRAVRDGEEWVISGQKVWTSLAHFCHWCFVLARTDPTADRHRGISMFLVPLSARGVEIRPITQLTGTAEFNEIFFTDTRVAGDLLVGEVNRGWKIAMGLLSFERGASTLGQQLAFQGEFDATVEEARRRGVISDARTRERLVTAWAHLRIMRLNTLRILTHANEPELSDAAYISKIYWAHLHQELGELWADVAGPGGVAWSTNLSLSPAARHLLFTRADTIYGGTDEIQQNIIAERALGLPRE